MVNGVIYIVIYSYISTINHRIQPFINQLNAILGGPILYDIPKFLRMLPCSRSVVKAWLLVAEEWCRRTFRSCIHFGVTRFS